MMNLRRPVSIGLVLIIVLLSGSAMAQKLAGKKLLGMLGKDEASVTKALGKPDRHFTNPKQPGFVRDSWGKGHYLCEFAWSKDKMAWAVLEGSSTWQASLSRYGLSSSGVAARDTGDNDFALDGVKGLPAGWTCGWNSSDHLLHINEQ